MLSKKLSVGIACCRYNSNTSKPEILLVQKRYSYSFQAFVFGHYYPHNDSTLTRLFDGMTLSEKIEVLSGKYEMLWYKIFLKIPKISRDEFCHKNMSIDPAKIKKQHKKHKKKFLIHNERLRMGAWQKEYKKKSSKFDLTDGMDYGTETCSYCKQKYKYDQLFDNDGRVRLLYLINNSKSIPLVWEIPKGQKKKSEEEIGCAIREFEEETCIQPSGYKIIMSTPVSINHISQRVCYIYKYYVSAYDRSYIPVKSFGKDITTLTEIIDTQWISLDGISLLEGAHNTRLYKLCRRILKIFKNRVKNRKYTFDLYKNIEKLGREG